MQAAVNCGGGADSWVALRVHLVPHYTASMPWAAAYKIQEHAVDVAVLHTVHVHAGWVGAPHCTGHAAPIPRQSNQLTAAGVGRVCH